MQFNYLKSRDAVRDCIAGLNEAAEPVVLDLETTGLDRFKDKIISAQLCSAGEETAYYFDEEFTDELAKLTTPLVLHNFKFDFAFLLHHKGIDLRYSGADRVHGPSWVRDTMLLDHLLDENSPHDLDSLVKANFGDNYKEVFWAQHNSFQEAPEHGRLNYACKDVVYCGKLFVKYANVPVGQESLVNHTHKLALQLFDTEMRGLRLDLDYLSRIGGEVQGKIDASKAALNAAAGDALDNVEISLWLEEIEKAQSKLKTEKGKANAAARITRPEFNWDSGKQLQKLIYGELGVKPVTKKSKSTGLRTPTLDDEALAELEHVHPLVKMLRDHREHQKVFGSFIEGSLNRQIGGRIYPSFSVNGTVTGRISSSNPNLQQLPRGGGIRGIYAADPGYKLIGCDYSQLEVVVAAHFSKDPALLSIIYDGASKHDITAAALKIDRQRAKTLNFALGYGATEYKVKEILGCSINEAKGALRRYWEAYAGEKKVIDECAKRVDQGLPIIGLYGRQRRFPKSFESDKERARAYRQAYNSLIQGSGADLVHESFYTFGDYMERSGGGRAIFEIHDEILGEAKAEKAEDALAAMKRIMEETPIRRGLSVPLKAEPWGPFDRWED